MNSLTCEDRLKNIVVVDKKENPQRIERLLKSELLYVLKNYFDVTYEGLEVSVCVDNNGEYNLNVFLKSKSIKVAKCF